MNAYANYLSNQPEISNQNFKVQIVKNVLLPEHIEEIYSKVNSTPDSETRVQPWAGHKVWDISFSKDIEDRITEIAQKILGPEISLNYDYSFARYSKKFGYRCKLFPHYDNRDSQRITFDLQLKATEPWGVIVENTQYNLEDNDALIFAGTQQIHWRENKDISDDAEIDMIFCHLQYNEDRPLDPNQKNILNERASFLIKQTGITNEVEPYEV